MKIDEIRKLSVEELNTKITANKKELLELRMKQATGNLEKPVKLREFKKEIARMKTILKEKEMEASK